MKEPNEFDAEEAYLPQSWRKRPVLVWAARQREAFEVDTLEGKMRGKAGDWLITGVAGEKYPCSDEIFRRTYERPPSPKAPGVGAAEGCLVPSLVIGIMVAALAGVLFLFVFAVRCGWSWGS